MSDEIPYVVEHHAYVPIPIDGDDAMHFYHNDPLFRQAVEVHCNLEDKTFDDILNQAPTCIRVPVDLLGVDLDTSGD